MFNNIKVSLRNLGTSPVATSTCERSFFAMRRLKAHAKGIMVSERLNAIALMHVHQEVVSDREKSHKSVNLAYFIYNAINKNDNTMQTIIYFLILVI